MIWFGTVASVVVLGILYGLFSGMNIAMMSSVLGLTADPAELGSANGSQFYGHRCRRFNRSPTLRCTSNKSIYLVGTSTP
ncbi:hypothetical protein BDN67DRAFT_202529 [Paxillus ammoniavirescens]|nr:hypothetical protein BDN67DRAFT_202529 [Paxillus ammoniavirescens]